MSIQRRKNNTGAATASRYSKSAGNAKIMSMFLVPLIVVAFFVVLMKYESGSSGLGLESLMEDPTRAVGDVCKVADGLARDDYNPGNSMDKYTADGGFGQKSTRQTQQSSNSGGLFSSGVLGDVAKALGVGPDPVDVPEWIPVFPGSVSEGTIRQSTDEGVKEVVLASVSATARSVANYYNRTFEARGFTVNSEESGGQMTVIAESADGSRTATIKISARGIRSTFSIVFLDYS